MIYTVCILKNTQSFIQNFDFDVDKYKSTIDDTGFNEILYLMFQDFKQNFEFHMINNWCCAFESFLTKRKVRNISY